mgnify:CR=1 FL=1
MRLFAKRKFGKPRLGSRNEKPNLRVYCPDCSAELDATCMKHNGTDNGEYYENWRCDGCGCRFVAVYDEDGDYVIEIESSGNIRIADRNAKRLPAVSSRSDIGALSARYPDAMTDEMCPCCDSEVRIRAYGRSECPECGNTIIPCSMCSSEQYMHCDSCPYGSCNCKPRVR